MPTKVYRRCAVGAKIEATPGTPETLAEATDFVRAIEATFSLDITENERSLMTDSLSEFGKISGFQRANISITMELVGPGFSATTPTDILDTPEVDVLLRVCGFSSTAATGSPDDHTYALISSGFEAATIVINRDGVSYKATGCRGTYSINLTAGEIPTISFELQGAFVSKTDDALSAITYQTTVPAACLGLSLTIDSTSPVVTHCIGNFSLDGGNSITLATCLTSASGYKEASITRRRPVGTINPLLEPVATYDWLAQTVADAQLALSCSIGTAAGEIITIAAPALMPSSAAEADRDGYASEDVSFVLARSAASNDELTIVFS